MHASMKRNEKRDYHLIIIDENVRYNIASGTKKNVCILLLWDKNAVSITAHEFLIVWFILM